MARRARARRCALPVTVGPSAAAGRGWRRRSGREPGRRPAGADPGRQRRRGLGRAADRLGACRRGLAGLARCPARRSAIWRACSPVQRTLGHQPGPMAHQPGVARHAHHPGRGDRRRAGGRGGHGGHRGVADHRRAHPAARRPGSRACRQPADQAADAGPGREDRHQAPPVAGRGQPAGAAGGRYRAAARRPQAALRPRPGPVRVLGRHHHRVHGAPLGQDDRAEHPLRPVRARRRRRHQQQGRPVGRHRAAPRRIGQHGVAVRPAADHRLPPALVVEPARRAGDRRGRPPARRPLRPHRGRQHQTRLVGASRSGPAVRRVPGRRVLGPVAARVRPVAGRRRLPDPRRAARCRRVPRPGRQLARRAERRAGNPRRHLPDRPNLLKILI